MPYGWTFVFTVLRIVLFVIKIARIRFHKLELLYTSCTTAYFAIQCFIMYFVNIEFSNFVIMWVGNWYHSRQRAARNSVCLV